MSMSDKEIRIALAKFQGFQEKPEDDCPGLSAYRHKDWMDGAYIPEHLLPDYFNDLNAIAVIEQLIGSMPDAGPVSMRDIYRHQLLVLTNPDWAWTIQPTDEQWHKAITAHPAKRTEACCRTLFPDNWNVF